VIVYPHYIRNRSQLNVMWWDNQPHGCSRPILFPHSGKRVRDCRQNIPWLHWNAFLTTPYVSEHYKYMFLVARDLYEMFVLYTKCSYFIEENIRPGAQRLVFKVKYEYTVGRRSAVGQASRQPVLDVLKPSVPSFSDHVHCSYLPLLRNFLKIFPTTLHVSIRTFNYFPGNTFLT